jgi:putrescine aminotransferase
MSQSQNSASAAAQFAKLDKELLIHPHQDGSRTERCTIVRGSGVSVWDAEGNELLDVMGGGNWVAQVGHSRPELVAAAAEQVGTLEYFTSFDVYSNDRAIELAQRIIGIAPAEVSKVFFTNGGSEGVETAMKAARLYHHLRGESDRVVFLGRHFAYHGCTYGSGAITGFPGIHVGIGPGFGNVERLTQPYPYRAAELYGDVDPTDFLINELEETIDRLGAGNIAAMIGEPVMGGGGVLAPPADYWPRVREVLSRNGILLIADEVVTSYGRTGFWFDSAQRGMRADIIVTAKGLTSGYAAFGAVLFSPDIAGVVAGDDTYFFHGHTFSGHPVAAAIALANLDVMERDGLLRRVPAIADWFTEALAPVAELPRVGDVRVVGATVGVELVADKESKVPLMAQQVATEMRRRHRVIVRDYGPTLVFAPPLVVEQEHIVRAADSLHEVLTRLGADGELADRA